MRAQQLIFRCRSWLTNVGLSILVTAIFMILVEISFRAVRYLVKGPDLSIAETVDDPELGWRLNTHRDGTTKTNKCDETVIIGKYDHPYLVKTPSNPNHPRVLFLGDSYTHGHEVSSGKAYFDVFADLTKDRYSVYSAGIGGFGNLQEYLLLERVWNEVDPDIVIWQLHQNDVANNVYALDSGSFFNNQRPRPYLDPTTGDVAFKDPGFFLFDVSLLFRFLFHRMLALDWTYNLGLLDAADRIIAPAKEDLPGLTEQGFGVLREVLSRAKSNHADARFFGFAADEAYDSEYRRIFHEQGAGYLSRVAQTVAEDPQPTNCLPLDSHWNHHGNAVAGTVLLQALDQALAGSATRAKGAAVLDNEPLTSPEQ